MQAADAGDAATEEAAKGAGAKRGRDGAKKLKPYTPAKMVLVPLSELRLSAERDTNDTMQPLRMMRSMLQQPCAHLECKYVEHGASQIFQCTVCEAIAVSV